MSQSVAKEYKLRSRNNLEINRSFDIYNSQQGILERLTQYNNSKKKYYKKYNEVMGYYMTAELHKEEPKINHNKVYANIKDVKWALKKYLRNIDDSIKPKGINLLLSIRENEKRCKRILFNEETMRKAREKLVKRELMIHSLGKKSIWKPQKYIVSKNIAADGLIC